MPAKGALKRHAPFGPSMGSLGARDDGPRHPCLATLLRAFSRGRHLPMKGETGAASRAVKAGCRKSLYFHGSGRMDAVVRHIGCGESRQGCRGPASRVSPCPSKSMLFQGAEGQPVRREALHRFLRGLPKIKSMGCETQLCWWFYNIKPSSKVLFPAAVRLCGDDVWVR